MTVQNGFAGDIEVMDAWRRLAEDGSAILVDVRTRAEWSYVGVPMLDDPAREPLMIEWLSFPAMQVHEDFCERLIGELEARDASTDAALLFLCRSGVRSLHAARAMAPIWQGPCFNIASGFEGDLDERSQRGRCNGWKHAGLPWRQF